MLKPMLAGRIEPDFDLKKLQYPFLVSPKLDGIRATVQGGVLLSRHLKPIRNIFTQSKFGKPYFENLDGELICGSPTAKDVYRTTNSGVMSTDGEPDVKYYCFDTLQWSGFGFEKRFSRLRNYQEIKVVPHVIVNNEDELLEKEQSFLSVGYEGLMIRSLSGPYKCGRSTFREGWLLKLKRFVDGEARIIGIEAEMLNANEGVRDATGKLKRSSHKANLIAKETAGSLLVVDLVTGIEFNIGTGLDAQMRKQIWEGGDAYLNKIVKYKHFPIGQKDRPRHPVFLGFRDPIDL